jgi:aspartokinase-like uncharacterized kinase
VLVKVGGGLAGIDGGLASACAAVAAAARRHPVVVVPGGGPFADAVRDFDRRHGLSPDAAHWMAILAMDQYAWALAERIEGGVVVESAGEVGAALAAGRVPVLAPAAWMRAADVLPHAWDATSDSVAAFLAGALGAAALVLIKPERGDLSELVDSCFTATLPLGLRSAALGASEARRLPALIDELLAHGPA